MKKKFATTLIATLFSATVLSGAAGVFALENGVASAQTARSDVTDELISPVSYEQYLPLSSPSDIALSERYIAIADGNNVHIYDKKNEEYQTFTHAQNGLPNDNIKKLQFCENGKLYYADNSTGANFYELDISARVSSNEHLEDIACSTFVIDGSSLYFANSSGTLYTASLNDYTAEMPPLPFNDEESEAPPEKPTLAFWNGELYFTDNGPMQSLYKFNPKTQQLTPIATLSSDDSIKQMAITAGILTCTTTAGDFCAYTLPRVEETTLVNRTAGNFTAVAAMDNFAYAVNGKEVRQYSVEEESFTSYSICSTSSLPYRLSGATDLCVSGENLLIADSGNSRVSVYDTHSGAYKRNFGIDLSPSFLSSDGETLLLANAASAALYSTDGEKQATFNEFQGNIVGAASVYGKHYLVTDANYFYALTQAENGAWQASETKKLSHTPKLLTADVYGNLYIASNGQSSTYAYKFTETEFTDPDASGAEVLDNLPQNTQKIAVDYEGNLYALADGSIYKNGNDETLSFTTPLVYASDVSVTAFAFGVEENSTYLLCDQNYLLRSERLALPTVKTIPVDGADEAIFSQDSAEFVVVNTKENALLIAFELEELKDQDYFPYAGYIRQETPLTALRLGEAGKYSLIAVYDETENIYRTYLALTSLTTVSEDQSADFDEEKTGYITSAVTLYKFPYLTELLTAGELPRGTRVQVLGELSLDHEYYQVSYEADGVTKTGYIPKSFVAETDGTIPEAETVVFGAEESDLDSLWRLAYILLGLAAIAILTDYLLLRKKKE